MAGDTYDIITVGGGLGGAFGERNRPKRGAQGPRGLDLTTYRSLRQRKRPFSENAPVLEGGQVSR
jgi:hypothetical protein